MKTENVNSLLLAYVGDAVYELEIRKTLLKRKIFNGNDLQKEAIKYVSAKSQEKVLNDLLERNILTEKELDVIKTARNKTPKSKPKNTSILTYKKATSLEALFGYLYLENNYDRIKIIMKEILGD